MTRVTLDGKLLATVDGEAVRAGPNLPREWRHSVEATTAAEAPPGYWPGDEAAIAAALCWKLGAVAEVVSTPDFDPNAVY